MLLEKISSKNKELVHKENLVNTIHKKIDSIELLMTIGAGDIDKYVPELKKLFEN
jgi:UDP-N-acetylmuramate-alanine ligase